MATCGYIIVVSNIVPIVRFNSELISACAAQKRVLSNIFTCDNNVTFWLSHILEISSFSKCFAPGYGDSSDIGGFPILPIDKRRPFQVPFFTTPEIS